MILFECGASPVQPVRLHGRGVSACVLGGVGVRSQGQWSRNAGAGAGVLYGGRAWIINHFGRACRSTTVSGLSTTFSPGLHSCSWVALVGMLQGSSRYLLL